MPPRYEEYLDHVLIPNGMLKDRMEKMASDIIASLEKDGASSVTLLCVLKGGFKFFADLIDELESNIRARGITLPFSMDFVRVQSYVNDASVTEPVITALDKPSLCRDKDILVVEDIIDTGKTMRYLLQYLCTLRPRSIRVASLLLKRTPLNCGYKPDFAGFEIPDRFVVGYAFDYNDNFRDMHHVCVINEKGKKKFAAPLDHSPG